MDAGLNARLKKLMDVEYENTKYGMACAIEDLLDLIDEKNEIIKELKERKGESEIELKQIDVLNLM